MKHLKFVKREYFGFFGLQGLENELALGVVEDSEVLAGLLDGDDV